MTQITLTCSEKRSGYPGQYLASPPTLKELLDKSHKHHEGKAKPLVNIVEMPDAFIIEMAAPGFKKQ